MHTLQSGTLVTPDTCRKHVPRLSWHSMQHDLLHYLLTHAHPHNNGRQVSSKQHHRHGARMQHPASAPSSARATLERIAVPDTCGMLQQVTSSK